MQTVVDDLLVNYEILGNKNKNTLLILHGWGRSLEDWKFVANRLSDNYRVILLDLPGFGQSLAPTNKLMDVYFYATFVEAFLKKLGVGKFYLAGHSFGGKVSIVIASSNPNVQRLFLIDSSGVEVKTTKTLIIIRIAKLFKKITHIVPIFPSPMKKSVKNFLSSKDYKQAGELQDTLTKVINQDVTKEAGKIKAKSVIIWGENDKEVPVTAARKLSITIPNSVIRIIWGAGHHPHLEAQDKFIKTLMEYL